MKIWKLLVDSFKKRICNERGIWPAIISTGTSLLSSQNQGSGGIFDSLDITNKNIENPWARGITNILGGFGLGALFGSGKDEGMSEQEMWEREYQARMKPATFLEAPRFAETDAARGDWWSKIQDLGKQPGFVDPSIMENVKTKLNQYYWGSPTGGGAIDKIRASAARRGVSDSPAMGVLESRMGAEQGGQLAGITSELGQKGQQTYLQNIMQLSNLQVPGAWDKYGGMQVAQPSQGASMSDVMGTIGSGLFDVAGNYYQNQWMEKMIQDNRAAMYGTQTPSSIGSTMGTYSGGNMGGISSSDLYKPTFQNIS